MKDRMQIIMIVAALCFIGRYIKNGAAHANHCLDAAKDFVSTLEADEAGEPR